MAKSHRKNEKTEPKKRPKSGFEKLVENKEKAKEKARLKIKSNIFHEGQKPQSSKKIIDKENVKQLFIKSQNKKNIFDLESDDEIIDQNVFVQDVNLFSNEGDQQTDGNKSAAQKKGKKEIFQEIIQKSKKGRLDKIKKNEEMRDEVADLNENFDKIRTKLQFSDMRKVRKTKFVDDSANYLKILDQIKGETLLRPFVNPKVEKKEESVEEEEGQWEQSAELDVENDENVEIGDFEEEELDKRDRRYGN